jgi:60S ribosomal subunit assembly/export protein LOC1
MAVKTSIKSRKSSKRPSKSESSTSGAPRRNSTSSKISRRPPKQQKTKPGTHNPTASKASSSKRKKARTYTDSELNLPTLNAITPISAAAAPRGSGKKKNKIYIDDRESMMTIMAMVNAEKEGQIESKMVKMRRMEEIREARRVEAERRDGERTARLDGVKRGFKRKSRTGEKVEEEEGEGRRGKDVKKTGKKSVSFA